MTEPQNKKLSKPIEDSEQLFNTMMTYNSFLFGRNFNWAEKGLTSDEARSLLISIAEGTWLDGDSILHDLTEKYGSGSSKSDNDKESPDDKQTLLCKIDTQIDGLHEYLYQLRWELETDPELQWKLGMSEYDLEKIRATIELIRYKHESKEEHPV